MTKKEKQLIYKICKQVRKEFCDDINVSYDCYLEGECHYVCEMLENKLWENKIYPIFCFGYVKYDAYNEAGHYWLEYKGNIIDLTACQFNRVSCSKRKYPLILIEPISKHKEYIKKAENL